MFPCLYGPARQAARTGVPIMRTVGYQYPQIVVLRQHAPDSVTADGRTLPHVADPAALRDMAQGWTFTSDPFGGVVLKLTPGDGATDVALTG